MRKVYENTLRHFTLPALVVLFLFSWFGVSAQVVKEFSPRYQVEQRGGIVYVSNSIMAPVSVASKGRPEPEVAINEVSPLGVTNNDQYVMKYVDADSDNSTFSSSKASLNLPPCSRVSFAGLYWGGASTDTKKNTVKLRLPGGAYQALTADVDFGVFDKHHYQMFKDITSLVNANPAGANGEYWVADIKAKSGSTAVEAGWTIVVVYQNDASPSYRNLTVFDGFAGILKNGARFDIPIAGFKTPPAGPVNFELGFVAYEGDRGLDGDYMQFNGHTVADKLHARDNTFNGTITSDGVEVSSRMPAFHNTLGYDASIMMFPNSSSTVSLGNNVSSASVSLVTEGDTYAIGVVTTAIDVLNPYYKLTHTFNNMTRGGQSAPAVGDEVELFYEVENIGNDASRLTSIIDTLPAVFEYIPNSLVQLNTNGTVKQAYSDAAGDDPADYDPARHRVVFRIGEGAGANDGGRLETGTKLKYRLKVRLTSNCDELRCAYPMVLNSSTVHYNGTINATFSGSNHSGPGGTECSTVSHTAIPIEIPASCLANPEDISKTIACSASVADLALPAGYQLFLQSDIDFSKHLDSVSESGTYIASKTVGGGCRISFKVNIAVEPVQLKVATPKPFTCPGDTTTVTLAASGGSGIYEYQYEGVEYQSSDTFILRAGTYLFRVKDSNGCTAFQTLVISDPPNAAPSAVNDTFTLAEDTNIAGDVSVNDTDENPCDTLTFTTASEPGHGKLIFSQDGRFTYSPDSNWTGADNFTYIATDNHGANSNITTVSLTVNPVNDFPVAKGDTVFTKEDEAVSINILANDSDIDGKLDPASITIIGKPTYGTLLVNADGLATYTPSPDYSGEDGFTYTVKDDEGAESNVATVSITISSVNDTPVAKDDQASTKEDEVVSINILANDTDIDGKLDPATITIIEKAVHGSVLVGGEGLVTYTPGPDYSGQDSFTYTVKDTEGAESNVATVSFTITPVNDAPLAKDDLASTKEDEAVSISILVNDTDTDGKLDPATITIGEKPIHGSLLVNAEGLVTYTPNPDYAGEDSFTYTVKDNEGAESNSATVSLTINPVNDAPVAKDDLTRTKEDEAVSINILVNDTDTDGKLDPATITIIEKPTHGNVLVKEGLVTYTPTPDYSGQDSFTYTVKDTEGAESNVATVSLTITPVNDAPVAKDDLANTKEDEAVSISILVNDTDTDGKLDPATITIIENPIHGNLQVSAEGLVTYTPNPDYAGEDSFTYTVKDNEGAESNSATVSLTINPLNDAPVAKDDLTRTKEDESVSISILANDTDIDGKLDPATITIIEKAVHGTLLVNAERSVTYTPNADYSGEDSFIYTVKDNEGAESNVATVSLTISSVNDAPLAKDDLTRTKEDEAVSINILANDTDIDGKLDPTSITIVEKATHGNLQVNAEGLVTYTPSPDYSGQDSFTYTVKDNEGSESNVATVSLTISSVNDAPVAKDDLASTKEDEAVSINILANDTDIDGELDPATITIIGKPTHGNVLVKEGLVTYTPNADYFGEDNFSYTVKDNEGAESNVANVLISISAVNQAPVAGDRSYEVLAGVPVKGDLTQNVNDADNDELTYSILTKPANGSLDLKPDGTFIFNPQQGWNGATSFTYQVCDPASLCAEATVSILVNEVSEPEVRPTFATPEDTPLDYEVVQLRTAKSAGPAPVVSKASDPSHGTVVVHADGSFVYTPDLNYFGPDLFSVKTSDGKGAEVITQIPIIVAPVNDAPVANDDEFCTCGDLSVASGNVLKNDTDVENDALRAKMYQGPKNGTLQLKEDGSFTYTPNSGFAGTDSFSYQAVDDGIPNLTSNIAVVMIKIPGKPLIGIAKSVTAPRREPDASYTLTYTFTVKNYGTAPLDNVQIRDDLSTAFPGPVSVKVKAITATGNLKLNQNYNGFSSSTLLQEGNTLPVSETRTVDLTLNVVLNGRSGAFFNQAFAEGSANGQVTRDISQQGVNPDPNNDGDPAEGEPTSVVIYNSQIYVPGGFSPNGDGVNDYFVIEKTGGRRINLEIFNRWGNVVFKDADYRNDWDGTARQGVRIGDGLPDGTYFYTIVVGDEKLAGSLTIKR